MKRNRELYRKKRHIRVRKKIKGTFERPRLNVYRSLSHIYVQIIDDTKGHTLVSASSLELVKQNKISYGGNKKAAYEVGKLIAEKALKKGINKVVFDRGGYLYHGRVAALAQGARDGKLEF
ncbi:MAG TPA: 50S ribosomal protein L18 [Candidatus Atribacteria bacterium]|nr:50S ribosomal protein L18 [Candidatus Atribacteria bacterium]